MNLIQRIKENHILAISIGLVYIWFGALKFFPSLSPAEDLAKNTIDSLTVGLIPSTVSIIVLAIWESVIGVCLLLNIYRKQVIILALIHMFFTFSPLFFFPDLSFNSLPVGFSLVGQYIFKNLIIISALITLYRVPIKEYSIQ